MSIDPLIWVVGSIFILALMILLQQQRIRVLRRRHETLSLEVTRMLALHQDYLAAFDARLRALGSRSTGDMPVPSAEEMLSGQWMR